MNAGRSDLYELYGLTVRSAIPLPARLARSAVLPDCSFEWGERYPIPADPPPGDILTRWFLTETFGVTLTKHRERHFYRVHGSFDFEIVGDPLRVRVHSATGADEALAPLFLSSSVLGVLLALRGETTLHASAVSLGGRALAIAGASGRGKSTLAALLCRLPGAELVTDDLLRLVPCGDRPLCAPGPADIRLRASAAALTEDPPQPCGRTADDCLALRPHRLAEDLVPLHGVVLPQPRRDGQPLRITRITGARVVTALARCPRILPWTHANNLRDQFEWFGAIARAVPVYEAELPWGPPFDPAIADALAELAAR